MAKKVIGEIKLQIEAAKAKSKIHSVKDLFYSGSTWEVK